MTTTAWTSGFVTLTLLLQAGAARGDDGALRAMVSDSGPWLLDAVIALDGTELLDGLALGREYNFASGRHPTLLQKSGAFSGFVAYAVLVPACSSPPTASPTSPGSSG